MQHCRYLEDVNGRACCVYWDLPLLADESIFCYPGGWECYEDPGGCIFEGRWMAITEYADHVESKSAHEIPEGYEFQEFRLDSDALSDLSRSENRHALETLHGEMHYLKLKPEYPDKVTMIGVARFEYGVETKLPRLGRPRRCQWVASLWIFDGPCQVDLALVRRDERLDFIEGYCSHGDFCPKVEELKQAILESSEFAELRGDLVNELLLRTAADLDRPDPPSSPQTVPPDDEGMDSLP